MTQLSPKIQELLSQVTHSLDELGELERSYKDQKTVITEKLSAYVSRISVLSDSQAIRAMVIRELYWNTNIPINILTDAFKMKLHRLIKTAGVLEVKVSCAGNCGGTLNYSYTSRSNLTAKQWYKDILCENCKLEDERASAERDAECERQRQQRSKELSEMPWDLYIETDEWCGIRDMLLHIVGYECEICHDHSSTLFIYPHKVTPQIPIDQYAKYVYFVLCRGCIPRCQDLLDQQRRDVIKPELRKMLVNRARGGE